MSSDKSLQLLYILPFGMFCLSAISMMFVKILLAVCMLDVYCTSPSPSTRSVVVVIALLAQYCCVVVSLLLLHFHSVVKGIAIQSGIFHHT